MIRIGVIGACVLLVGALMQRQGDGFVVSVFSGRRRWSPVLLFSHWRSWLAKPFRRLRSRR